MRNWRKSTGMRRFTRYRNTNRLVSVLLDADGQLVGKAADRLPRRRSERDVRIFLWPQSGLLREVEERSLVAFGTQPPAASIAQHSIENHHPFDHAADRAKTTVPVVRLANRFVERLVVDVVQASTSDGPWLDGSRESAGHQPGHELPAVLAAHRAGELAVPGAPENIRSGP